LALASVADPLNRLPINLRVYLSGMSVVRVFETDGRLI